MNRATPPRAFLKTGSISTRSPMRASSTPSPAATILPQASAPCILGKTGAAPVQPESSALAPEKPALPPAAVPSVTEREYQAVRVLMSVLFTPAASTRIKTSPALGTGRGTSSRNSS